MITVRAMMATYLRGQVYMKPPQCPCRSKRPAAFDNQITADSMLQHGHPLVRFPVHRESSLTALFAITRGPHRGHITITHATLPRELNNTSTVPQRVRGLQCHSATEPDSGPEQQAVSPRTQLPQSSRNYPQA